MNINYTPPPTCREFMLSSTFLRIIAGPVGSGKTTACLFELFRRASEQAPAPDGIRYTRFAILRQTLKQLKDTVLKDITSWLRNIASYKVSENLVTINVGDIHSEWLLLPLEEPEDQERLLSMQLTGAWVSEGIEINPDLMAAISGRCGRYPSGMTGVPSWFGIIVDTNMPSEGSPWHTLMTQQPPDWEVFFQPSGMSPEAENLEWLTQTAYTLTLPASDPVRRAQGRTYYERLSRSQNKDWVRRYVEAQFGDDPSGTAVFRESFIKSFHVRYGNNDPVRGWTEGVPPAAGPLLIGLDFGRDPCAAICQMDHLGRFLCLGEVVVEDMGLENMLRNHLRPMLMHPRYIGRPAIVIGDPAGVAKSSLYEVTSFDMLKAHGFTAYPAPTNDIDPRIGAVDAFLLQQRNGGPAFIVDGDHCPNIVRGLNGGYRYAKTRAGQRKPIPDKNKFSHVMDGLQYAALAAHGGMVNMLVSRMAQPRRAVGQRFSSAAWT